MKFKILLLSLILLATCAGCNEAPVDVNATFTDIKFIFNNEIGIGIEQQSNNLYTFSLTEQGQNVRQITSTIYRDEIPYIDAIDDLHGRRIEWNSNLDWHLSDSASFVIRRTCPYPDWSDVECAAVINEWVPSDTIVIDYFEGMTVPTINPASYPNGAEVSTVIAPIGAMVGDTMIVVVSGRFGVNYDVIGMIRIILE